MTADQDFFFSLLNKLTPQLPSGIHVRILVDCSCSFIGTGISQTKFSVIFRSYSEAMEIPIGHFETRPSMTREGAFRLAAQAVVSGEVARNLTQSKTSLADRPKQSGKTNT